MLTSIFLLFAVVSKVTANPLLQALTSQSCPICQPNNLKNQLTSLLFQPPVNNQPCPPTYMAQNPTAQPMLNVPNQCPSQPQYHNNQCNPILNKLLSNSNLRSILDPNTRLFNQNGQEVQRNGPPGNGGRNVINNYIIVPPELLLEDAKCNKEGNRNPDDRKKDKGDVGGGGRRKAGEGTNNADRRRVSEKEDVNPQNVGTRRKARRKKNKIKTSEVKVPNETAGQDINQIQFPVDIKQDEGKVAENNNHQVIEEFTTQPSRVESRNIQNKNQAHDKASPSNNQNNDNATKTEYSEPVKKRLNNGRNLQEKPRRRTKQSNKKLQPNRKAREEEAINEFCRKFPNIPEKLVRDLLNHMKRQIEKEQLGVRVITEPPSNKDNRYNDNVTTERPLPSKGHGKRRRKNRRGRKRRPQNKTNADSKTTIELTATIPYETTTETLPNFEELTATPTEATILEDTVNATNLVDTTTPKHIEEDEESVEIVTANHKKDSHTPDLGSEDVVPVIYENGLVDDYYPDFTGDMQYYSSEDSSAMEFHNDRYHYTTDRNYELEELNRDRRRFENNFERNADRFVFRMNNNNKETMRPRNRSEARPKNVENNTEKSKNRPRFRTQNGERRRQPFRNKETVLDSIEQNTSPPVTARTAEIKFRTPPTLEKIDFETKPVNKNYYYHDDLELVDKVSTYSDSKTPQYNAKEKTSIVEPKKKHIDEIETVFAKSKVMTYGRPVSDENVSEDDGSTEYDAHDIYDDKRVVFAKPGRK